MTSYRAGENSQILGLLNRLELPYEIKRLSYGRSAGPIGLARRVSIAGLRNAAALAPPWVPTPVSCNSR